MAKNGGGRVGALGSGGATFWHYAENLQALSCTSQLDESCIAFGMKTEPVLCLGFKT